MQYNLEWCTVPTGALYLSYIMCGGKGYTIPIGLQTCDPPSFGAARAVHLPYASSAYLSTARDASESFARCYLILAFNVSKVLVEFCLYMQILLKFLLHRRNRPRCRVRSLIEYGLL